MVWPINYNGNRLIFQQVQCLGQKCVHSKGKGPSSCKFQTICKQVRWLTSRGQSRTINCEKSQFILFLKFHHRGKPSVVHKLIISNRLPRWQFHKLIIAIGLSQQIYNELESFNQRLPAKVVTSASKTTDGFSIAVNRIFQKTILHTKDLLVTFVSACF